MSSLRLAKLTQLMKESQKQQVVTKSFGQRVDLYTNFNLFNDMKDSIYVEQEGRTVGDVEVLPGKTLSGCLTNSNLTVHFTNLMGGKDSKVIDSNELRTLIPSLTVKAGELSPTLNISKVLIDISIKKFNSLEKSAGFIPSVELPKYEMLPEPKYKEYKMRSYEMLPEPKYKEYEMRSYIIEHPSGSKLKSGDYEYEVVNPNNKFNWKQISTGKTGTFDLKAVGVEKWNEAAKTLNGLQKSASIGSFAKMRKTAASDRITIINDLPFNIKLEQTGRAPVDLLSGKGNNSFYYGLRTEITISDEKYKEYSGLLIGPTDLDKLKPTDGSDKSVYVTDLNSNLKDLKASLDKAKADTATKDGSESKPATRTSGTTVQLLLPAGQAVSDGWGTYTGIDQNSFSYVSKDGRKGTYNNKKSGWKTSAERINKMWADKSAGQTGNSAAATAGTATDTQPATAPAAKTEEAKPAEATRQFDPSTLAGVKAVLIRAAKPGGLGLSVGTAANERRRIQKMIETISSLEGPSIDAYDFLTKMLLVSPRGDTYLTAFFRGASQADIDAIMTSPRKDVVADPKGGKYNRQVAAVLSVLNEVYDGDFSEDNTKAIKDFKTKYVKKDASKLNNSITKTSSKVDPKIKKLATLRRLRVRSQMEEATESATRFGRSRIS